MDKKEGCYCSPGNALSGHKFHPRWLRSYWELESMGQQTLLRSAEREFPGVLYSCRRRSSVSIESQCALQHWCSVCGEVGDFQQRKLLYRIRLLYLQLHCDGKHS